MEKIKITEDRSEIIAIGKSIFESYPQIYDKRMTDLVRKELEKYTISCTDKEKEDLFYESIYNYWVYGASIKEFFFFGFQNKTHEEKNSYLTQRSRLPYTYHMNDKKDFDILEKKYNAYEVLKEFYKRDVIKISSEEDYDVYADFVGKHKEFVIKPEGLGLGIGIRKASVHSEDDAKKLFDELLQEGKKYESDYQHWKHANVNSTIVLEQIIEEDECISKVHPYSVNPFRISTILIGDTVHFFYPWIKFGNNKNFTTNAFSGAIACGIDVDTGIINSNGITEMCEEYESHPLTGLKFKGFQIPYWDEMKKTMTMAAKKLPSIRYVGWDVVLSKSGWCIMEGNFMGEFVDQLIYGRGSKHELESLIGWKMDKDFWWEYNL